LDGERRHAGFGGVMYTEYAAVTSDGPTDTGPLQLARYFLKSSDKSSEYRTIFARYPLLFLWLRAVPYCCFGHSHR